MILLVLHAPDEHDRELVVGDAQPLASARPVFDGSATDESVGNHDHLALRQVLELLSALTLIAEERHDARGRADASSQSAARSSRRAAKVAGIVLGVDDAAAARA